MDNLFFNQDHIMIQDMVREFAESEIMPIAGELDKEENVLRTSVQFEDVNKSIYLRLRGTNTDEEEPARDNVVSSRPG